MVWTISGHMDLLIDADFIDAENTGDFDYRRITWSGHEFLDSVRDDEVWRRTKDGALAVKGFSADLLLDLAKGFARKKSASKTGH